MKIINVCSGKGGVGKTTVAVNMAAALQKLNKRVVIVDCNLTTSHLGVMFDLYSTGKSINGFLRGEIKLEDAVHMHKSGLHIVPAALELDELADINTDIIKHALQETFKHYDYVILDSAPGIGREALIAMKACDEAVFVASPHIPSLVDVLKTKNVAKKLGVYNAGVILNRVRGRDYEITEDDVFKFADMHLLGSVPEDEIILSSLNEREVSSVKYPKAPSSAAFFEIAHKIAGVPYYTRQ